MPPPHLEMRDLIYQLKGAIMSASNEIEGMVDFLLRMYFMPADDPRGKQFETLLLGALDFRGKVKVLKEIADTAGLADEFKPDVADLNAIVDLRNEQAHSHFQWSPRLLNVPVSASADIVSEYLSVRRGRQPKREPADVEKLRADLEFIDAAGSRALGRFSVVVVSVGNWGDLKEHLDEITSHLSPRPSRRR